MAFQEFIHQEVRYTSLLKAFPQEAQELFNASEENAKWRYNSYKRYASMQYQPETAAEAEVAVVK